MVIAEPNAEVCDPESYLSGQAQRKLAKAKVPGTKEFFNKLDFYVPGFRTTINVSYGCSELKFNLLIIQTYKMNHIGT